MRKPRIKNKYNLTMKDIRNLQINDRTQLKEPLFWRNHVVKAWCISKTTIKNQYDDMYGTYNSFWIGIFDENCDRKVKFRVNVDSHGGMCSYNFKKFFDYKEIECDMDLEIQEKLLETVNQLIDMGILVKGEVNYES